ncbi:hypothetical protein B0J14DRAFT_438044, partial [Halenospora varia]
PHLAQGAAQAIEDRATLSACLSRATSFSDIPILLKIYESIRNPRTEKLKAVSKARGQKEDLPNGEEQIARDANLR